ncbi:MAG: hypothetical protein HXY49_06300 [Ignavibacteriaceae bacterium]|nr:hypothetical protein [Ignavibacteriaceae bacterium]
MINFGPNKTSLFLIPLTIISILLPLSFLIKSDQALAGKPFLEDAFYSLTISRNISQGYGVSYDKLKPANGFQPLYVFMLVPVIKIAGNDSYALIRIVSTFNWVIWVLSAVLFASVIKKVLKFFNPDHRWIFFVPLLIYTTSIVVIKQHFNGLETGLMLLTFLIFINYYMFHFRGDLKSSLIFGVIAGLLILSRIDTIFFIFTFLILHAIKFKFRTNIKSFIVFSLTAFIVSSPWFIYNLIEFGSIMPTSGRAQQEWAFSLIRFYHSLTGFFNLLIPSIPFVYAQYLGIGVEIIIQILTIILLLHLTLNSLKVFKSNFVSVEKLLQNKIFTAAAGILISNVMLIIWYSLSSYAIWFYTRYFASALIPGSAFISFLSIIYFREKFIYVFLLALITIQTALIFTWSFNTSSSASGFFNNQLSLVEKYVPENERVAAFQSGTLGFFRNNVVNLDGKVNSDIFLYNGNIEKYLNDKKINWICDSELNKLQFIQQDWEMIDFIGGFELYRRVK